MVNFGKQIARSSKQNLGNNTKQTRPSKPEVTSWSLGWKSYVDDLLNGLTHSCKLPHIIVGIPSKEPE